MCSGSISNVDCHGYILLLDAINSSRGSIGRQYVLVEVSYGGERLEIALANFSPGC